MVVQDIKFPIELWTAIIKLIQRRSDYAVVGDLLALTMVCRALHVEAEDALYRHVAVGSQYDKLLTFLRSVASSPRRAGAVRTLCLLRDHSGPRKSPSSSQLLVNALFKKRLVRSDTTILTTMVTRALGDMVNLVEIRFHGILFNSTTRPAWYSDLSQKHGCRHAPTEYGKMCVLRRGSPFDPFSTLGLELRGIWQRDIIGEPPFIRRFHMTELALPQRCFQEIVAQKHLESIRERVVSLKLTIDGVPQSFHPNSHLWPTQVLLSVHFPSLTSLHLCESRARYTRVRSPGVSSVILS